MQFFLNITSEQNKTAESSTRRCLRQKCAVCRTGSCKSHGEGSLGLVAEALLVAIGLHALAALVLADLGLPTLLKVAHGFCSWG